MAKLTKLQIEKMVLRWERDLERFEDTFGTDLTMTDAPAEVVRNLETAIMYASRLLGMSDDYFAERRRGSSRDRRSLR